MTVVEQLGHNQTVGPAITSQVAGPTAVRSSAVVMPTALTTRDGKRCVRAADFTLG